MPKTESAGYSIERLKYQTAPVYFVRFFHVPVYGGVIEDPFSRDFCTHPTVVSATVEKFPALGQISGGLSRVTTDEGRATIGNFTVPLVDLGGEILKYLSRPPLHVQQTMTASVPGSGQTVILDSTVGLPSKGTLEITSSQGIISPTAPAIERIRYSSKNDVAKTLTVSARGVGGTIADAHAIGDAATNGEVIRPGQRMQLYAGYAPLAESDYMPFAKQEVTARTLDTDSSVFLITTSDMQRTQKRDVFTKATKDAPVRITGKPITIALYVMTSTGRGTNGNYDILSQENGLAIPLAFIDVTGFEHVRDALLNTADTYSFIITGPEDGKKWLEDEIYKTMNCYPVIKQDGRLSLIRYST